MSSSLVASPLVCATIIMFARLLNLLSNLDSTDSILEVRLDSTDSILVPKLASNASRRGLIAKWSIPNTVPTIVTRMSMVSHFSFTALITADNLSCRSSAYEVAEGLPCTCRSTVISSGNAPGIALVPMSPSRVHLHRRILRLTLSYMIHIF